MTTAAGAPGPAGFAITITDPLADGLYTAVARQRDVAGNTGRSGSFTFTVDTSAPEVAIKAPVSGSVTGDNTPDVSGTAEPGLVVVELFQGGTASGQPDRTVETTANAIGQFAVTVDASLADDLWTARASQTDPGGNIGESNAAPFVVDTGPPVVTLQAPGENGITTDSTPEFRGSAEEGPVSIAIHTGNSAAGAPLRTVQATAGSDGAFTVSADPPLPDGPYAAVAEQTDAAGNEGASQAVAFVLDATAPSLSVTGPADDAFLPTSVPTISGKAGTADRDGDAIRVTLAGPAGGDAGDPAERATAASRSLPRTHCPTAAT